jgi:SAM-dependent methyltransferase
VPVHHDAAWDRALDAGSGIVSYGPDIPNETELRLLGDLSGKRVLELGCGGGAASIAMSKQGAHAIAVDPSADSLSLARRSADAAEVRVELHQSDLADLAFVRADTVDMALSIWALGGSDDLNRVFRQVHRVLKTNAPFVFSLPHPAYDMIDDDSDEPLLVRRSYFDRDPTRYEVGGTNRVEYRRTISDLVTGLSRANFRVDVLLEPEPATSPVRSRVWRNTFEKIPRTLIIRARKEGI